MYDQNQQNAAPTQDEMLAEILENSRKTKNYMKWQLIITVALVVLPLLTTLIMVPILLNSLGSIVGGGMLDGGTTINSSTIDDLIKQYQQ